MLLNLRQSWATYDGFFTKNLRSNNKVEVRGLNSEHLTFMHVISAEYNNIAYLIIT